MSGADLLRSRLLPALLIRITGSQDLVGYLLCAGWILYQLVQLTHLLLDVSYALCVVEECMLDCFEKLLVGVEFADANVEISHCVAAFLWEQIVATAGASFIWKRSPPSQPFFS